jgi:hypothetical protein
MSASDEDAPSPEYLQGLRNLTKEEVAELFELQAKAFRAGIELPSLVADAPRSLLGFSPFGFPF